MSKGFVASRQKLKVCMFYKMIKEQKGKGVCKTDVVDLKQIFTESKCHFLLQSCGHAYTLQR